MRAKDHGVAGGQHTEGIVDNGLGRIGGQGDRTNDAIGGVFGQRQAAITADGGGDEIFNPGVFCAATRFFTILSA